MNTMQRSGQWTQLWTCTEEYSPSEDIREDLMKRRRWRASERRLWHHKCQMCHIFLFTFLTPWMESLKWPDFYVASLWHFWKDSWFKDITDLFIHPSVFTQEVHYCELSEFNIYLENKLTWWHNLIKVTFELKTHIVALVRSSDWG